MVKFFKLWLSRRQRRRITKNWWNTCEVLCIIFLSKGREREKKDPPYSSIFSFKLSLSGVNLAIMSSLCTINRELCDNLGQPVNCISLSNDGNCILASCLDSTLRLLDRYVTFLFFVKGLARDLFLLVH